MDQGPSGLIRTTSELAQPVGAMPLPQQQQPVPQQPPPADWMQQQMAEQMALEAAPRIKADERAAEQARIEELKGYHSAVGTGATKLVEGALNALLGSGALFGLAAESAGELFESNALRDFGRDVGEAAQGASAMQALGGLATAAAEGAYEGAGTSDAIGQILKEQEEARPLLSTLSKMAGMAAVGVGAGLGAAGHSGRLATMAAGAFEGAGGGAQVAYEHSAPLRDVLTSAAVGGVLGGAIAGAGELVQAGVKRAPDLAKVFGEKLQGFADGRALKAVIDRDPVAWKTFLKGGPERVARVADRIRAADVLGKSDEGMLEALVIGANKAGDDLSAVAKHLDDAGIVPDIGKLRERLMTQVDDLKSGSGTSASIAESVEREIAPLFDRLAIKQMDDLGQEVIVGHRNPSFTELRQFKTALGKSKKAQMRANTLAADEVNRLYGNVAETLNEAADHAGPIHAQRWKHANESYADFSSLKDALENQIARKAKNRFISPSDYGTSIGAGLTTAIMSGNPIFGGLAAIGTAIGHKALREGGSAIMSSLANRFARMSTHVSLAKAGGAEAQEVLQAIAKTKAFMSETADRAGANPTLRKGAEDAAKQVAAEQLAKKAGPFDPTAWASKPLNPLQKVLYRSQVLDAVSTDLSRVATEVASLHPAIPDALDLRRLSKLTRDADGPEAIGSLQRLTGESAQAAPRTPTGDAGGVVLRRLGQALDRTDPAQSIAKAHEAAAWFRQAQAAAPDELSQQFAARTEAAIRAELSQPHWGAAGVEYGKMAAPPHAILAEAADPAKVRELLRMGGHLGASGRAAMDQLAQAVTSAAKLTGQRAAGLGKQMRAVEELFDAAEKALTIDGKPIAALFEAAQGAGVHSGAAQVVGEHTLAEHVETGLEKIEPLLHGNAPRIGASVATEITSREQYDKRMKVLTRTVAQPDSLAGHPMYAGIAPQVGSSLAQLVQDMPKPQPSIHGKVFETLSQDDLRLANAMWEATTEPLSVFNDLAEGTLDPDKASYAWKQYPALQKAAQAGVIDVLMGLPDEKRAELPDTVVTQLDTALGFNGTLQDANEPSFAQRMSALYIPAPAKGKPGGMLDSPAAEPTFVQRIGGAI